MAGFEVITEAENSVRIANAGFRSIRKINFGQQVLTHVTFVTSSLATLDLLGD